MNSPDPLHTTPDSTAALDAYVLGASDAEPEYLYRLWRATNLHLLGGRMASGALQGRLLRMLVHMVRPRNILEVGTFSGYSALSMAQALAERGEGHLYTFEINDELEPFTRSWIEQSPWADRVTFIIGDARTEAQRQGVEYDLAFLDGDKRTYQQTFDAVFPLMAQGAFLLVDNTLWDGHVLDPAYAHDAQTQAIDAFNRALRADRRVEQVLLPLRDGLTIVRKV